MTTTSPPPEHSSGSVSPPTGAPGGDPEMELFMRLHAYAYNPSIHYPNPYVDTSRLHPQQVSSYPSSEEYNSHDPDSAPPSLLDYSQASMRSPYGHYSLTPSSHLSEHAMRAHSEYQYSHDHSLQQHPGVLDYSSRNLLDQNVAGAYDYDLLGVDKSGKKKKPLTTNRRNSLAHSLQGDDSAIKRRVQVKIACIHCKKACKKCDNIRPCGRCVRLGLSDSCVDAPRKERKKGFKRAPFANALKMDGTEEYVVGDNGEYLQNVHPNYDPSMPVYQDPNLLGHVSNAFYDPTAVYGQHTQ